MSQSPPQSLSRSKWFDWCGPAVIVFLQLIIYSAVQAPVPGVNEPQYLGKAAHVWDPSWAAGDRFLESSNPHFVFYIAVGWLTKLASLETTAWIARVAGYGILAFGWTALASAVTRTRWAAVISTALFLLCGSVGNLSGEWLVGGIEGKVFSYGLLFLAVATWLEGRLPASALCLGLAISLHPIVGIWGLICVLGAEGIVRLRHGRAATEDLPTLISASVILTVTALPGIIPAAATLGGDSPKDIAVANYLQVFWRLRHHLDPTTFAAWRYAGYAALFIMWLCATVIDKRSRVPSEGASSPSSRQNDVRWLAFVALAVVIAVVGVAIGWHFGSAWHMPLRNVRTTLLKFYPFRLADVFVPLACSLTLAKLLVDRSSASFILRGLGSIVTVVAFAVAVAIPLPDRNPSRLSPEQLAAWKDVADWARNNTARGTVFVTPSRYWGFKWYAHRAEYVNFKDSPQDTEGLLEWKRRLDVLREWWTSSADGRYSQEDLKRLGDETGAEYFVTYAYPRRFEAKPLYENGFYRVYSLR